MAAGVIHRLPHYQEVIMGKKNRHKCKAPYRAPPQCGKYQKKLMKAAADERQRKRRR